VFSGEHLLLQLVAYRSFVRHEAGIGRRHTHAVFLKLCERVIKYAKRLVISERDVYTDIIVQAV
jgi:hypothetical protein